MLGCEVGDVLVGRAMESSTGGGDEKGNYVKGKERKHRRQK